MQITDNAFRRISELTKPGQALRIAVDAGGCSGYRYDYEMVSINNVLNDDHVIEQNNIKVVIDPISQKFLVACTLDFIEELGSSYFKITNPQASASCGCGNSFST